MKYLGLFPDVPDLQGCSDGGCVFRPPTGMHTNGGCACMKRGADPLRLQLNLQRISRHMESMRAELGAQRARANENELCAAAVVEIRRLCKEIMGGNLSFVDDDFARCLLTLRAERDALAAENSAFGKAMQKVKPLNKCEIGAFRAAYSDASMMSRFRDAMAARGIEVGE